MNKRILKLPFFIQHSLLNPRSPDTISNLAAFNNTDWYQSPSRSFLLRVCGVVSRLLQRSQRFLLHFCSRYIIGSCKHIFARGLHYIPQLSSGLDESVTRQYLPARDLLYPADKYHGLSSRFSCIETYFHQIKIICSPNSAFCVIRNLNSVCRVSCVCVCV